jgi:hypothetical protein
MGIIQIWDILTLERQALHSNAGALEREKSWYVFNTDKSLILSQSPTLASIPILFLS